MNRKRAVDLAITFIFATIFIIAFLYPQQIRGRETLMWTGGILAFLFFVTALKDHDAAPADAGKNTLSAEPGTITEVVLLSEEDTELCTWDIYGRTAAVIGRDVKENQVDIDLNAGPYASMVDIEHAVMNFASGSWYVEDLKSRNGIRVKKAEDGKIYQLSADTPCRVERGDILYVGLNRLLLR